MSTWQHVSADPNTDEPIKVRAQVLRLAHRAPIYDRTAYLTELARGKRVLDVGVVNHVLRLDDPRWLHGAIVKAASYCLGVDILPDAVAEMQKAGYNVKLLNITTDRLDEDFDLMIVGEVIEHLTDPGALFRVAAERLLPGGKIVLTTPNPHYLRRVRDAIVGAHVDSVDHAIFLYPSGMAEIAERHGLKLTAFGGIGSTNSARGLIGKLVLASRSFAAAVGISPDIFCNGMYYEFTKA